VASIVDKMRENRLKWAEHVLKREETETERSVKGMYIEGKRGNPENTWLDVIDMKRSGVRVEHEGDRVEVEG